MKLKVPVHFSPRPSVPQVRLQHIVVMGWMFKWTIKMFGHRDISDEVIKRNKVQGFQKRLKNLCFK